MTRRTRLAVIFAVVVFVLAQHDLSAQSRFGFEATLGFSWSRSPIGSTGSTRSTEEMGTISSTLPRCGPVCRYPGHLVWRPHG